MEVDGAELTLVALGEVALVEVLGEYFGRAEEARFEQMVVFKLLVSADGIVAGVHLIVELGGLALCFLAGSSLCVGYIGYGVFLFAQGGYSFVQTLNLDVGIGELSTEALYLAGLFFNLSFQILDGKFEIGVGAVA